MKKKIPCIFFLVAALVPVCSGEVRTMTLGEEDGWRDLRRMNRVVLNVGKQGYYDIKLADGAYEPSIETDLLLHFDRTPVVDAVSSYRTIASTVEANGNGARLGTGGGVFRGAEDLVVLEPSPGDAFSAGRVWSELSMEFWLYPVVLDDEAKVIEWRGSAIRGEEPIVKSFRVSIRNRSLVFSFDNLFTSGNDAVALVEITSPGKLVPRKWHHHMLRYRSDTGLIEYLRDGRVTAVTHATQSGREESVTYSVYTGNGTETGPVIGGGITGFIDELRVSEAFIEDPFVQRYRRYTGTVTSRVFDLEFSGSLLHEIDAAYETPGDTAVLFYFRTGDKLDSVSEVAADWRPFRPGSKIDPEARGRYLQLRAELLPDGYGMLSPVLHTISFAYEPDLPPHPPERITTDPGNGRVSLSWSPSLDRDVAGYLVYYGDRPGVYFGDDSDNGKSPIDVGNVSTVTLEGLENGKLYYFSIVAYDANDPPHESEFSREVASRPSSIHNRR